MRRAMMRLQLFGHGTGKLSFECFLPQVADAALH
jgi:hypothetical protein